MKAKSMFGLLALTSCLTLSAQAARPDVAARIVPLTQSLAAHPDMADTLDRVTHKQASSMDKSGLHVEKAIRIIDARKNSDATVPVSATTSGTVAIRTDDGWVLRDRGRLAATDLTGNIKWIYDATGSEIQVSGQGMEPQTLIAGNAFGIIALPDTITARALLAGYRLSTEGLEIPAGEIGAEFTRIANSVNAILTTVVNSSDRGDITTHGRAINETIKNDRYRISFGCEIRELAPDELSITLTGDRNLKRIHASDRFLTVDTPDAPDATYTFYISPDKRITRFAKKVGSDVQSVDWSEDGKVLESGHQDERLLTGTIRPDDQEAWQKAYSARKAQGGSDAEAQQAALQAVIAKRGAELKAQDEQQK